MADIPITMVAKVIEGAIDGDMRKVKAYAESIADFLEDDGAESASRIIQSKLDGSYKNEPKVTLD